MKGILFLLSVVAFGQTAATSTLQTIPGTCENTAGQTEPCNIVIKPLLQADIAPAKTVAVPVTSTTPVVMLPSTFGFLMAGYGTKIDGTVGYGQLISQASQTYSATGYRFVPVNGKFNSPTPVVLTGLAPHLRRYKWLDAYGLAQAGAGNTATGNVVGAFQLGGFGTFTPSKWKHTGLVFGADMCKTAGGKSYPNFDFGLVLR